MSQHDDPSQHDVPRPTEALYASPTPVMMNATNHPEQEVNMVAVTKPKVVMSGVNGMTVWALPGSTLEIMWAGPGAHLWFGHPRVAGGVVTRIEHATADGAYDSRKDAETAVAAFIAAGA